MGIVVLICTLVSILFGNITSGIPYCKRALNQQDQKLASILNTINADKQPCLTMLALRADPGSSHQLRLLFLFNGLNYRNTESILSKHVTVGVIM